MRYQDAFGLIYTVTTRAPRAIVAVDDNGRTYIADVTFKATYYPDGGATVASPLLNISLTLTQLQRMKRID